MFVKIYIINVIKILYIVYVSALIYNILSVLGDGLSPRTDAQNNKGIDSRLIIAESRFNGNLFVGLGQLPI